jgi:cytochrome c553
MRRASLGARDPPAETRRDAGADRTTGLSMEMRRSLLNGVALAALSAWAQAVATPAHAEEALERGRKVFELCLQCHGEQAEGNAAALAPAIAGLPEWYVSAQLQHFAKGERGMHPDDVGGLRMYPMTKALRSESDFQAVAAYVASLTPRRPEPVLTGGDPGRGAQLYQPCTACHGPDGGGNPALGSPALRFASDWYLLSSLQKFKTGVRGSYPNAAIMRGMAAMLPDEQAMKDVIAYIGTLQTSTAANAAPAPVAAPQN